MNWDPVIILKSIMLISDIIHRDVVEGTSRPASFAGSSKYGYAKYLIGPMIVNWSSYRIEPDLLNKYNCEKSSGDLFPKVFAVDITHDEFLLDAVVMVEEGKNGYPLYNAPMYIEPFTYGRVIPISFKLIDVNFVGDFEAFNDEMMLVKLRRQ